MGGDTFEGCQKLTNEQYIEMTAELLKVLEPFCERIEPYIPVPEKVVHGDIDFLIILKKQHTPKTIVKELHMETYKLNNNDTINSLYKNKQVDYFFVGSQKEFELASFYKSYSGIGAYLGTFLPSKEIKLTTKGLLALGYEKHMKLEFVLCDQPQQILKFYGLSYERYKKGFETRKSLLQYLREVRFLDEQRFAYYEHKHPTKLITFLSQHIKSTGVRSEKKVQIYEKPHQQTMLYFNKKQEFEKAFQEMILQETKSRKISSKFNGGHLLDTFQIDPKQVKVLKQEFKQQFQTEEKYAEYIENHELKSILSDFQQKFSLEKKPKQSKGSKSQEAPSESEQGDKQNLLK